MIFIEAAAGAGACAGAATAVAATLVTVCGLFRLARGKMVAHPLFIGAPRAFS